MEDTNEYLAQQGAIVTDLALRISTIERLLITKNILTEQDILSTMNTIREELMEMIKKNLERVNG